jgi:PAS domain S-box-containing protein
MGAAIKPEGKERFRKIFAQACGALAAIFGLVAMLGWVLKLPLLPSFGSGLIPMAPSSALLFLLSGVATFFQARLPHSLTARRMGFVVGSVCAFVSLSLLILSSQGIYLDVEKLGLQINGGLDSAPIGHMSPVTALLFLFASLSFLILLSSSSGHPRRAMATLGLVFVIILVNYVFVLAYFVGLPLLYSGNTIPPALPSNLAFLSLGGALFAQAPSQARLDGKNREDESKQVPYTILLVFVILTLSIVTVGYLYYRNYEQQLRIQVEHQLSAIAELKVSGLVSWRNERLSDAEILYNNPTTSVLVQRYFEHPEEVQMQGKLRTWLESYRSYGLYDRIRLLDTQGITRLSTPSNLLPVASKVAGLIPEVMRTEQITLVDFYRSEADQRIYMDVLTPIFNEGPNRRIVGFFALRIDPAIYLYPYINQWPTPSMTADTMLVRQDGEDALYLNELKFQTGATLTLRTSLRDTQVLAVKALLGQTGIVEGVDYRGVAVIGYVRAVPDSPWYLVACMDTAEVYAPLTARLWQSVIFFGTLILASGAGLIVVWRQQRLRYYRAQAETAEALVSSEARYRRLFEAARDGILILDAETGIIMDVNPFLIEMLGSPREEICGKELWELGFFKDFAASKANFLELQQKEYIRYEDLPLETTNGRRLNVEFISNVYQVDRHKVVQCNIRDITERKQTQDALRESDRRLREAQKMAQLGHWRWNIKTGEIEWSEEVFTIFRLDPKEFTPHIDAIQALSPWPEDHERDKELVKIALESPEKGEYEQRFLRPDGSIGHYLSTFQGEYDADGNLIFIIGTAMDITSRKQMEENLRESEERYRSLHENSTIGIYRTTPDGQILLANPSLVNMLGCSSFDELSAQDLTEYSYEPAYTRAHFLELMEKEGELRGLESTWQRQDGSILFVRESARAIHDPQGKILYYDGTIEDITEQKHAEDILRESEKRFRSLFENMLNGFAYCQMLFDQGRPQDFIYLEVNRAFETLTGLKDVNGKKVSEVIPGIRESDPELFEIYARVALTGLPESFEVYVEALAMWFFFSVYSPKKEYFVTVFDVITNRKRAEQELKAYSEHLEEMVAERTRELRAAQEQLVRQERLATLGQLAGSIGHELRNPLGVISNAIYFLKMSQPEASDKVREYLDIMEKETHTSDKIVTDLLDFTRAKFADREPVSVFELVDQTLKRYPAPPSVQVTLEIPEDLPKIYTDLQHIAQILGNLLTNAFQSMTLPHPKERASSTSLPRGEKLTISAVVQGDLVNIAVQDTGPGIPPENMDKLFQPLFTTKSKGIGLGLAVSKKLAEANGGKIEVESVVGQGSTFMVFLPVYDSAYHPESLTGRDKESK